MNYSVFYSWQSDLPNKTNRNVIQSCIKRVIRKFLSNKSSGVLLIYDESTRDIAGTPDIAQTIIQKIDRSDIFICDVSIINSDSKNRKCPNPNVLFELGYAACSLGWDKVICVFNLATGKIEELPFDINHKRILTYNSEIDTYKDCLAKGIEESIELMISKGLLYNPLKDHMKGKIDYCILEALKQVCCIVYGVYTMSNALTKVSELLSFTASELERQLADGHQILGFFAKNDLQGTRQKLDEVFSAITLSSVYPVNWALIVLRLIDWLRSYQWYISERSGIRLCTSSKMSSSAFRIISGRELNPDNPPNSYILTEDNGRVLYSATMAGFDKHISLTMQNIVVENAVKFGDCFFWLIKIANEWLTATGGEFILDPDYYPITPK